MTETLHEDSITLSKDLLFSENPNPELSPSKEDFSEISIETEASSTIGISNETSLPNPEPVTYDSVSSEKETHISKPFEGEFTLEEPFTTTLLRDLKIVY